MWSSLPPTKTNPFIDWFEEHAIEHHAKNPKLCLSLIDYDTVSWQDGDDELQIFLNHLDNLRPTI